MAFAMLTEEYRGALRDLTHFGYLTVVDEHGKVIYAVGDPEDMVFYRSSSKPVQALPVMMRGVQEKYGLTQQETAIFSASHSGEEDHVAVLESIFQKAELTEDMLVMKPTVPAYAPANEARIRKGLPTRKFYHNCSGKHTGLLLLQRELGGEIRDYWKMGALAQQEVQRVIACVSETEQIELGIDGCGVPVFAVPIKHIATAFLNLAVPERIRDEALVRTAAAYMPALHAYPRMIAGTGRVTTLLNADPNIVCKSGANGVYAMGLKKERLGIAWKFADGTAHHALVALEVLRGLGCLSAQTEEGLLAMQPYTLFNDNDTVVGERKVCFSFPR